MNEWMRMIEDVVHHSAKWNKNACGIRLQMHDKHKQLDSLVASLLKKPLKQRRRIVEVAAKVWKVEATVFL